MSTALITQSLRTRASDIIIRSPVSAIYPDVSKVFKGLYSSSLAGEPSILGLSPTRSTSEYMLSSFSDLNRSLRTISAIGGSERTINIEDLRKGADVVIGTPGRVDWLIQNQLLVTRNIQVILLDKSNLLLSSEIVLRILKNLPATSQRVLLTNSSDPMDPWLKDTIQSITRPCGYIDVLVELNPAAASPNITTRHCYSIINQSDQMRQLRAIVDNTDHKKTIVYVRSSQEVEMMRDHPLFTDWYFNSLEKGGKSLSRFKAATRATLVTHDTVVSFDTNSCRKLFLGPPKSLDEYMIQVGDSLESLVVVRKNEFEKFSANYLKKLFNFVPTNVPGPVDLSMAYLESVIRQVRSDVSSTPVTTTSNLVKMHGPDLVTGLLLMAEERRVFDEKTSPFSGEPGYSPVLLVDPFMKKIRTHEMCHKIVSECLRSSRSSIGRIALSEKGFIVDVPNESVAALIGSPKLTRRNIHAVYLTAIPRIIDRQKSFIIKRLVRDRKLASRLLLKRKR